MKGERLDRPVGGRQWMGQRAAQNTRGAGCAPRAAAPRAELNKNGVGRGWHGFRGKNGVGWAHRESSAVWGCISMPSLAKHLGEGGVGGGRRSA
jgi:hypothetical protein